MASYQHLNSKFCNHLLHVIIFTYHNRRDIIEYQEQYNRTEKINKSRFYIQYLEPFFELLKAGEHEKAGQLLMRYGVIAMEGTIM